MFNQFNKSDQSDLSDPSDLPLISRFLARYKALVPTEASVLVAVSGGGDSTALLHLLHRNRKQLGIKRLGVMHVNHGLRGAESDADESFIADLARMLDCPLFLKKLKGGLLHAPGTEQWGRRERYRFFLETREREGYDVVATGHTASDQAETVLMRIIRGAGVRGMRGILPKREDGIVRPIIDLWREEIVGWLEAQTIGFRSDSSNRDHSFERNRIRLAALPMLEEREPGACRKLVRIAELSAGLCEAMQPAVDRWVATQVQCMTGRFRVLTAGFGDDLHAGEGLMRVFDRYGIPFDSRQIEEMIARRGRRGREFLLQGGSWRYYPAGSAVLFVDQIAAAHEFNYRLALKGVTECPAVLANFTANELEAPPSPLPADNLTVALDREACGSELFFRSIRKNDRFIPFGGSRAVGVGSFLTKQGILRVEFPDFGVVATGDGRIIWIPGVRIAQAVRVRHDTGRILELSYRSPLCPII